MKRLAALFLCALLALAAGCSPVKKTVVRLGIYAGSPWQVHESAAYELIEDAAARFEAAHPQTDVVYESGIRITDYQAWLDNAVVLGNAPDVFVVLDEAFGEYASLGVLHNLDSFLRADETVGTETFFAAAAESGKYQYSQYALPFLMNPRMMFVNVTLLEQEGLPVPDGSWTPNEFLALCEAVTRDLDGDGDPDQFGCVDYTWLDLAEACGLELFVPDGSDTLLSGDDTLQSLETYRRLQDSMAQSADREALMEAGRIAFAPMSYAEFVTYNPWPWKIKKYSDFEWICVEMPEMKGLQVRYTGGSVLMAMSASTRQPDLSWELMKTFCADEATQTAFLQRSQGFCARQIAPMALEGYLETSGLSPDSAQSMLNRKGGRIRFARYEQARERLGSLMESAAGSSEDLDLALIEIENDMRTWLRS